jgi:uncharacterized protein (TIGR02646 family)
MRKIRRLELGLSTRFVLAQERRRFCDDASQARGEWEKFRSRKACAPIIGTLREMAGARGRCFYCCDSLAADVEHFRPIATDFESTFSWSNMLWVCPTCNRKKNARGPIENGRRVLVDPTRDDPWTHLTLASPTGLLAPRYLNASETDLRGEKTLEILDLLNYEEIAEGRARAMKRMRGAVASLMANPNDQHVDEEFVASVTEDDYGVGRWFARWEGRNEEPFIQLKGMDIFWRRFVRLATRTNPA